MTANGWSRSAWAILVFAAACGSPPSICEEAYPVVRARTIDLCLDEPDCAWCECFETMGEGEWCAPVHSNPEWEHAECDDASADTLRVCLEDEEACDELILDLLDFACPPPGEG
jgi:hypothetical protein